MLANSGAGWHTGVLATSRAEEIVTVTSPPCGVVGAGDSRLRLLSSVRVVRGDPRCRVGSAYRLGGVEPRLRARGGHPAAGPGVDAADGRDVLDLLWRETRSAGPRRCCWCSPLSEWKTPCKLSSGQPGQLDRGSQGRAVRAGHAATSLAVRQRAASAGGSGTGGGDPCPAAGRNERRVRVVEGGPVLVEGPVELELDDGTLVRSERFVVAVCACRRSKTYPICDTSHRRRRQPPGR